MRQGDYGDYSRQGYPRQEGDDPRLRPPAVPEAWQGRGEYRAPAPGGHQDQSAPYPQPYQGQPQLPPQGNGPQSQPRFQPPPAQPQFGQPPQYGQFPPYGLPPQYARQPSLPRGRRSHRAKIAWGVAGVSAVIAIAVAAGSGGGAKNAGSTVQGASQEQAATTSPAAVSGAKTAQKTVAVLSGTGVENTPRFTVTSTWKLNWSFNCSNLGQSGNFIVLEDGSFGAMNVNVLALAKTGSSYAYNDGGTHYLEVDSECAWTAKVIDAG